MNTSVQKYLAIPLLVFGGIILITALLTLPTFFLWNWLMPLIFGLPKLTILQALGVTLLSSILFKSTPSSK
jgi:hypothetical protein